MIARRIHELIRDGSVYDKETETLRRIRYSDIVILARSIRGWAETCSSVLGEEGIPAYSVSREGYFETYEVSVLLDYLRILDNARQDLPLAAVLTSPFGGLDARELAAVRIAYPNMPFYQAAQMYAEAQDAERRPGQSAAEKLRKFYAQAAYFRRKVPYTPIHELLEEVMEKTGYRLYITAMPGGAQRAANLDMLTERAAAFEGSSYKGLFNFIRYIEQLKKYDVDYGEAGIMDEQENTVRIMSIHKSKGLEFPVVFVAGLGKNFNTQDLKGSVLLHSEWGAGLDLIDLKRRTKTPTFLKKMIRERTVLENLAEEMRVLYVALTRAKEKLIMTGAAEFTEDGALKMENGILRPEGAKKYLDWILPCIISEDTGAVKADAPVDIRTAGAEELRPAETEIRGEELAEDVFRHWDASKTELPEFRKRMDDQLDYSYPFENEGKMKLKFTVSELKKRAVLAEEAGEEMYEEPEVIPLLPAFMKEEEALTGASRGSAYHKLMELLDFREEYGAADGEEKLAGAVGHFRETGRLTEEMAACIRSRDILRFLTCRSGRRMSAAARAGRLYREQPFVMAVDAREIYPEDRSGEKILVQGIIDVYFEEADGLTVLDYKTDRVKTADELKEKIIYSFTLGEEIIV